VTTPLGSFQSSRTRGTGRSAGFRLLCELGSVRMAALLIGSLATVIGAATVYERAYGAPVAAVMVYQAWWFAALFALLAICLICAVVVRVPLRRHQWGFAIVHLGLLVLMGGFWAHVNGRLDGMLEAAPGAEAARIELPTDALTVVEEQHRYVADFQPIRDAGYPSLLGFLARDIWLDPPARIHQLHRPRQLIAAPGLSVDLTAVLDTGSNEPGFAPAASAAPAALVTLTARTAGSATEPVARTWLAPGRETILDQGLVIGSLMVATSPHAGDGFDSTLPPSAADGELVVGLADRAVRVPAEAGLIAELAPDLAVRVERVLRNPKPTDGVLVQDDGARLDPVVEYSLGTGSGEARLWTRRFAAALILAPSGDGFPDVRFEHPLVYAPGQGQGAYLQLLAVPALGAGPRRLLVRRFTRSKGLVGTNEVQGSWEADLAGSGSGPMQLHARIDWLPSAGPSPEAVTMQAGKQDRATRWARFRFSDGTSSLERWFHRDEVATVTLGTRTLFASYRRGIYDLREQHGFALRLEHFEEGKDPGGMRSASFSSQVTVLPTGGAGIPALVTMNEPLYHAGVTIYQTAFRPELDSEGRPTGRQVSVFTAATDPGRVAKYLGSLLLVAGIVLLYLMRRRTA
jgi:hypothetical protein